MDWEGANSYLVIAFGDVFVVVVGIVTVAVAIGDVAVADDVAATVGDATAVAVWVQQCWMRACKNPQSHLVSVVVTLRGRRSSWGCWKTTQGPHSIIGRRVCRQR